MNFDDIMVAYPGVSKPPGYIENENDDGSLELSNKFDPMAALIDMQSNLQYPELESPFPQAPAFQFYDQEIQKEPEEPKEDGEIDLESINKVINYARQFTKGQPNELPYIYGAQDPKRGFDCSGLIQYAYKQIGVDLPRTSRAMAKFGTAVSLDSVRPGDIIYSPGHVKMVSKIQNGKIFVIEAKGRKWGIIEHELKYTKNIEAIRRVIANTKKEEKQNDPAPTGNTDTRGRFKKAKDFANTLIATYKQVLKEQGLDPNYAYMLTASAAVESGWGTHVPGNYNYGGVKAKNGRTALTIDYIPGKGNVRRYATFRNYESIKDYCRYVVNLVSKSKRYRESFNLFTVDQPSQQWRYMLEHGYGGGSAANINSYMNSFNSIYKKLRYGK